MSESTLSECMTEMETASSEFTRISILKAQEKTEKNAVDPASKLRIPLSDNLNGLFIYVDGMAVTVRGEWIKLRDDLHNIYLSSTRTYSRKDENGSDKTDPSAK